MTQAPWVILDSPHNSQGETAFSSEFLNGLPLAWGVQLGPTMQAIATQLDREAELALVEASRGLLPLESALLTASLALSMWQSLGESEYWAEIQYWENTIAYSRKTGKAN